MDEARGERPRTTVDPGIGTLLGGNGVRGVGCVLVFATHVFLLADVEPDNNMRSYGWAAPFLGHIDLALSAFFVLSGYLIARPYARHYVIGTRKPRLRSYVRNRVLRVVPAFYFFTVLVLLRFGLDGTLESGATNSSNAVQILGQFLFLQGQTGGPALVPIGPAWSIAAEVGFYIIIPPSAWLALRLASRLEGPERRAAFGVVACGAIMLVSIWLRQLDQYRFAWLTSPPAIMYGFMPGVAIALAEPVLAARLRDRSRPARLIAYGAFALAAVFAVVYAATDYDARQTPIHHALGQRALLAALCCGLLVGGLVVLQLGTGAAPRVFANRALQWMGERSYSFYLVHIWVLYEIDHLLGAGDSVQTRILVMGLIGFPLVVSAAALSYRYVERPFLERKRKAVPGGDAPGGSGKPPDAHSLPAPALT
jgi:peptidoglycan/LPS O-acetylase OafA/YrhL